MAATYESDRARKVWVWAIVVGGIAGILAVATLFSGISETELIERDGFQVFLIHVQTIFICLSAVVAVTGYILAWWHKLPAGILLILAWGFLLVVDVLPDSLLTPESAADRHAGPEASGGPYNIFGVPALVAGILFFWYLWLSRKRQSDTAHK